MKAAEIRTLLFALLKDNRKRDAARVIWPWFVQNDQTERIWDALEKYDSLAIMGHGSASKTFTCAAWFLLDWWTYPDETALVITSDTIDSMKRRIWSDMKTLWSRCKVPMGGILVDSKRVILYSPLDYKNAISGIAAESNDAQSKIQGLHTKRVRVIIDEADNKLSGSIWGALHNLGTSGNLKFVALANPADKTGEFGRFCEPVNGFRSINPEQDFEWTGRTGGHVLRLDGLRSPNLLAGKNVFPFLLSVDAVEKMRANGQDKTKEWWSYIRAWYPPEGSISNIFTSDIIEKCRKRILWYAGTQAIAACDPAFEGGDVCTLFFGRMGRLAEDNKKTGVQVDEFITINRQDESKPITIDFGDQIIAHLKRRGVKPGNFAIDCTGNALGLSDYIKHAWGMEVVGVNFGGSATEMKLTAEDTVKASDRYDRFVSELWYTAREWCKLGAVGFIDPPRELTTQLESRLYELVISSQKIKIETKLKMKERGLTSPDYGDAFCLMIHLARLRSQGFLPAIFDHKDYDALKPFRRRQSVFNLSYGVKEFSQE